MLGGLPDTHTYIILRVKSLCIISAPPPNGRSLTAFTINCTWCKKRSGEGKPTYNISGASLSSTDGGGPLSSAAAHTEEGQSEFPTRERRVE